MKLSYVFLKEDNVNWDKNHLHNKFQIIVEKDGISASFDYWGSRVDYETFKRTLTAGELQNAFEMICEDAISGRMSCEEFVDEFFYDSPCEALKTWKACKETNREFDALDIDPEEIIGGIE